MAKLLWLLLTVIATSQLCDAYKFLVWFSMPARSHNILGTGIVKHLLKAGHEVTYVTPFPTKNPPPNLREIDVSENNELAKVMNLTAILDKTADVSPLVMLTFANELLTRTMNNPDVVRMLGDTKEEFDAVIAEWVYSEVYSGLGTIYGCPFIWLSTVEPHSLVLRLIDENTNPAYVPDAFSSNVPPFSFKERIQELFFQIAGLLLKLGYADRADVRNFENLFVPYIKLRGRPVPDFEEVRYNASLMLGNSHVSMGHAIRLPQAYKPIAGYHIDTEMKPLPEDLKKLLDNSKNGLIYFSMGSNLDSKDIPETLKKGLLKVFAGLKQTVLWKFEEQLSDLPSNVHILNWAPQQSILAHPNCILFITHGGLLSTTESIHFGKPIIGIPVFGDQLNNIDRSVKKGFALRVDLSYDMVDELKKAIDEVLNNPRFAQKAKELSFIYHHRPVSPGEELVHWVEHVVQTRGAPHLRSPALHVPLYQKMYLDLLVVVLAIGYIIKKVIVKLCCSKKKANEKKKRN